MKKSILFLALLCATFAACEKDCEKDHTATVKVTNSSGSTVLVFTERGNVAVEPSDKLSFEMDLDTGNGEVISQTVLSYYQDTKQDSLLSRAIVVNQCETTNVEITD